MIAEYSSTDFYQGEYGHFVPVPLKILAKEKEYVDNEAAGADVRFQIIPEGKHIFLNQEHIKVAVNTISEFAAQIMEKKS